MWKEVPFHFRADPNKIDVRGLTPLHIAATYGNYETIELLIEHKANIWSLDARGFHPAKVAALNRRLECCRILDSVAIHLNTVNPEYVKQQQTKALKAFEKRIREAQKEASKKHSNTLPRTRKKSESKESQKKKKSPTTPEQNFLLQRPGENGEENDDEDKSEDDDEELCDMVDISGKNALRPLPKMQSGAMLNTLNHLAAKKMTFEYPDDFQASNSEPNLSRHRPHTTKAITHIVPLDANELELENDSPLATFLHSVNIYDDTRVLLHEKVDLDSLSLCSQDDLKSVGLPLGPIKKIHEAITRRNEILEKPGPMIDTDLWCHVFILYM